MARAEWILRFSWRGVAIAAAVVVGLGYVLPRGQGGLAAAGNIATAEVVLGDFVDLLTFRGDIKAHRSVVIHGAVRRGRAADRQARAPTASEVKKATSSCSSTARRPADAAGEAHAPAPGRSGDRQGARAGADLGRGTRTEQMKGQYDVERAKLDVGTRDVVSTYDGEKAELR